MHTWSKLALAALLAFTLTAAAVADGTATLKYDAYGFSVAIPSPYERIAVPDLGAGGMQEAYSNNGLAYVIIATTDVQPKGASCKQMMAAMMQMVSFVQSQAPTLNMHTLSATTTQGIACSGFGLLSAAKDAKGRHMGGAPPEIRRLYGDDPYVALMMVPIVDSPALLGVVLVAGPPSRGGECDIAVAQVAATMTLTNPNAAKSVASGAFIDPRAGSASGKDGKKPAAPLQPAIKPFSELKKGQIELVGVVKSTDSVGKCVDMLVGQAVPFGGRGTTLSPPRLKRVYVKAIAEGVKEGALIIVVANDTGPGKSVTADTLTVMDMSKMGF